MGRILEAREEIDWRVGRLAELWMSNNLWQRSQADTDSWHELFDIQAGPVVGVSSLSI